jgi:uncharacterized membrane protein
MPEMLYVLAASYDDVDDALDAYRAVEAAWRHVSSEHTFDATVVAKDPSGKVEIVSRHDEPVKHGSVSGLGWGLATGAVVSLFPMVGIVGALAVGGGAGAALGAVAGHTASSMSRDDLKTLGEVLDDGDAGLVVVYPQSMAGHVNAVLTKAKNRVEAAADISGEELAADVREARARSAAPTGV